MLEKLNINNLKILLQMFSKTYLKMPRSVVYYLFCKLNETSRLQLESLLFQMQPDIVSETLGTRYDQSIVTQTRNIVSVAFSSERKTFTGVRSGLKFRRFCLPFRGYPNEAARFGFNINIAAVA